MFPFVLLNLFFLGSTICRRDASALGASLKARPLVNCELSMQEEKMEPANGNETFNSDSSWKLPTKNSILMRASQLSSQFERGDQSYLRLSLGQFFEQRSEALGCLGSANRLDAVKRVRYNDHFNLCERCVC